MKTDKKDILCSIKPQYVEKILNGHKTVELRRKFPLNAENRTLIIYSTSPIKSIVATSEIKKIERLPIEEMWSKNSSIFGIEKDKYDAYFNGLDMGFSIHLKNITVLPKKIPLSTLISIGITAPQSYRYIDWKDINNEVSND